MRPWLIRAAVLLALVLVLWQFGPRAYVGLAARLGGGAPPIDLERVGAGAVPAWIRGRPALSRSVLEEIAPILRGRQVAADDRRGLADVATELEACSWVEAARFASGEEGGLSLQLQLARPVLEVIPAGAALGKVPPAFLTAGGICLFHCDAELRADLPRCSLHSGPVPGSLPRFVAGREHPDPRALAAAAVAAEWHERIVPELPEAPPLIEVDASNLNYRLLAERFTSQVRVVLRRKDGQPVRLDYGLPPGQPRPRVTIDDKVRVLEKLLAQYPGLIGVAQADLRFVNLWKKWVRLDPTQPQTPGPGGR